jgi:hypothetical protein
MPPCRFHGRAEGHTHALPALQVEQSRSVRVTTETLRFAAGYSVEEPAWQALDSHQRRQRILEAIKGLLVRES